MDTSTITLFYVCAITFSVGATGLNQNNTDKGYGSTEVRRNVTERPPSDIITECMTPNNKTGYCLRLTQCSILLKQLQNKDAWKFLRASVCKNPGRENLGIPTVCCGSDDNFQIELVFPKPCGYQGLRDGMKVYGGREASLYEFPWMALILHQNGDGQRIIGCTGFLIHPKFILTAAHCTDSDAIRERGPIVSVLFGEHDIRTAMDCSDVVCVRNTQIRKIDKIISHPNYDSNSASFYNDIAIIKLRRDASITDFVKPICLLEDDSLTPVSYFISGWGKTQNDSYNKVKLIAEIRPFDKVDCIEKYSSHNINLQDTQICAIGEAEAVVKDTCSGDSGGPLMIRDGLVWYAAGIVSFGLGCGKNETPGVYTNIPKFMPWIKSELLQELKAGGI